MKFDLSQADAFGKSASRTSADVDAQSMTFQLTELQRVTLIALSADTSTGGDAGNTASVLDLAELGVRDLATNKNNFDTISLTEAADAIKPVILSATINLDQPAVLIITSSEILDSTPTSQVDPSALRLSNDPGDAANGAVVLTDSVVTEGGMGTPFPGSAGAGAPFEIIDDYKVRLTLTEADRALAIAISATPGGNGVTGRTWTARTCKDSGNLDVGDASSALACTGVTGNTYTAASCVGGGAAANPYSADADGTLCTTDASPGTYTGASCTNGGDAGSQTACQGPGATGYTWAEAICTGSDGNPNADGQAAPTRHTCLGAMVLDVTGVTALRDIAQNHPILTLGVPVAETADTTSPIVLSAAITLGDGKLVLTCDEYIDLTAASDKVDLSKIHLGDASGQTQVLANLVGADSIVETDGYKVTITLSEAQRVHAIEHSGQPGGDNASVYCDVDAGALKDIAQNDNSDTDATGAPGLLVSESPDLIRPQIASLSLELGTGVLTVTASETVDVSKVNLTRLFLSNSVGENTIRLQGDTALDYDTLQADVTEVDGVSFQITLTEVQRVRAIENSGTDGGDGAQMVFDAPVDGGFTDIAQNDNLPQNGLTLTEIEDSIAPVLLKASLDYSDGTLVIDASETIDSTPSGNAVSNMDMALLIVLSNFHLAETTGATTINLAGANSVVQLDRQQVTIVLSESQRAAAVVSSGMSPGGDGSALKLDCSAGAVRDIAGNLNVDNLNLTIIESPDIVLPTVTSATLDLANGRLVVLTSETLDLTPTSDEIDLDRLYLANLPLDTNDRIVLTGATPAASDSIYITVTLTEPQRVKAIQTSGTQGGDGGAVTLEGDASAFNDLSANDNLAFDTKTVVESRDNILPTMISAAIDYSTGVLVIFASETIDADASNHPATSGNPIVLVEKLRISQVTGSDVNAPAALDVVLTGAGVAVKEALSLTVTLTEQQRVDAIAISATPGGDGTGNAFTPRNCVGGTSAAASYTEDADGQLCVSNGGVYTPNACSGGGDATSHSLCTGSVVLDVFADAMQDIGQNKNIDAAGNRNLLVVETADTIPPTIVSSTLNLGTGVLTITADEYIDATPSANFDLDKIRICDKSGVYTNAVNEDLPCIHIVGAQITETDGYTITLQITERQRANAIAISATPGGDGTGNTFAPRHCVGGTSAAAPYTEDADGQLCVDNGGVYTPNACSGGGDATSHSSCTGSLVLDALAGAVQDVGTVNNLDNLNIPIVETPDTIDPVINSCEIDYNNGYVRINTSEIIDVTPSGSTVDLTKLKLVNAAGDDISTSISTFPNFGPPSNDAANLVGSNITDADNEWIELIIPELARSLANQFGGGSDWR